jgi:hypothetical protein
LYRKLGVPEGQSGRVLKISPPPEFDSQTLRVAIPTVLSGQHILEKRKSDASASVRKTVCLTDTWIEATHLSSSSVAILSQGWGDRQVLLSHIHRSNFMACTLSIGLCPRLLVLSQFHLPLFFPSRSQFHHSTLLHDLRDVAPLWELVQEIAAKTTVAVGSYMTVPLHLLLLLCTVTRMAKVV